VILIIVATCTLLIAPVHRMSWFLGGPPPPLVPVLLIWMAPIYVGMLYDLITRRIVHPPRRWPARHVFVWF